MSFILCTSGAIVIKAGANVNSTAAASAAILQQFSDESEGFINGMTRYDWVANYGSISTNFKPILADACSSLAASYLIAYNMGGYTTRGEAEDMINILYDRAMKTIDKLTDDKTKKTMGISNN